MADQDPYAATAVKAAAQPAGDPYATTAVNAAPPAASAPIGDTVAAGFQPPAKPTERERFLNPELYPVGRYGEGIGENLHNLAQRAGVGIFQLADAAMNPRQTVASILASILPKPAVHVVNRAVDLENKIPGAHYLTTHLPENVPNPLQQAYSAVNSTQGPWELAGKAAPVAGQALAGELFSVAVPSIASDIKSGASSVARGATDTGEGPVLRLVKDTRAANEKIADVNADRLERQKRDQATSDAKYRGDLLKLRQQYEQDVREATEKARTGTVTDREQHQAKQLAAKQKYDQSVRAATEKYQGDKAAAEQANAEAQRAYNRKIGQAVRQNRTVSEAQSAQSTRAAQLQVGGSQIIYRLRQLDQNLRTQANAMYAAVRARMADTSLPSDTLADTVKAAQQKWIRGSPEKVREFNAMLSPADRGPELTLADQTAQNMGYKDFRSAITNPAIRSTLSRALPPDVWEAAIGQGTKPISWNDLQGFYEETGAKIADGPQPGKADIYKALQQVHEEIGNQMQQLANAHGAGEDFRNARSFYREYMQTFHTPTGPSSSGSVVAQVLRAKDPLVAAHKFASSAGERGIADLRQYDDGLANLAQDVQRTARNKSAASVGTRKAIADIPQPKNTPVPTGPSLPLPPVLESSPAARSAALPLPPIIPDAETVPADLKPTRTISAPDIVGARQAAAEARRAWVNRRGAWVATWPIFEAMRALWGGHIPAIPTMMLESAGTYATVRAASAMMSYPPMIKFLTQARPEDVALIPPELRGDLPGLVAQARQQGISVAPALIAAVAGQGKQNQTAQPATQPVLQGVQ